MSTHETPADLEFARDMQQADFESREHEVTVHKKSRGPFATPLRRPSCAKCGPIGDWLTDAEDARTVGKAHVSSMAADVAAGVSGDEC